MSAEPLRERIAEAYAVALLVVAHPLRTLRCLLGVASPSRAFILYAGDASPQTTWLDRWEHRIDEEAARRIPDLIASLDRPRWLLQLVDPLTGTVVKERDVTVYSHRSRRMRLNRWRRMQSHAGMWARLVQAP